MLSTWYCHYQNLKQWLSLKIGEAKTTEVSTFQYNSPPTRSPPAGLLEKPPLNFFLDNVGSGFKELEAELDGLSF